LWDRTLEEISIVVEVYGERLTTEYEQEVFFQWMGAFFARAKDFPTWERVSKMLWGGTKDIKQKTQVELEEEFLKIKAEMGEDI